MSRTAAKAFVGILDAATALMDPRQREKTISRILVTLGDRSTRPLDTRRGVMKLQALRGPYVASSVVNFETDEPETLYWIEEYVQSGQTLWDIGACVGLYSLYAAMRPGVQVVAFEPKAVNFGLLVEHIEMNGMGDRIMPLCIALGDKTGLTHLQLSSILVGGACNSLAGASNQFGTLQSVFNQGVPAMTADDLRRVFGLPAPDHIKLDVDGIEGLILRGGTETLTQVRSIIIEVEGDNMTEAESRLEAPLAAAGLIEDLEFRTRGSGRNRLYVRR